MMRRATLRSRTCSPDAIGQRPSPSGRYRSSYCTTWIDAGIDVPRVEGPAIGHWQSRITCWLRSQCWRTSAMPQSLRVGVRTSVLM